MFLIVKFNENSFNFILFFFKFCNYCLFILINILVKFLNNIIVISCKKKKVSNIEYYWFYVKYWFFIVFNLMLIVL